MHAVYVDICGLVECLEIQCLEIFYIQIKKTKKNNGSHQINSS